MIVCIQRNFVFFKEQIWGTNISALRAKIDNYKLYLNKLFTPNSGCMGWDMEQNERYQIHEKWNAEGINNMLNSHHLL